MEVNAVCGVLRGDERRLGVVGGLGLQKIAAWSDERDGGDVCGVALCGGKLRPDNGSEMRMIGAFVFGEKPGRGDVIEVVTGVVKRCFEGRSPDKDERADDQAENAGEQAQTSPRMRMVH